MVFEALPHTPVSSYGLNFLFHRKTALGSVGPRLGTAVEGLRLGLFRLPQGSSSAKIHYTTSSGNRVVTTSVEPSVRAQGMLYVGINFTYRIEAKGFFESGRFSRRVLQRTESMRTRLYSEFSTVPSH